MHTVNYCPYVKPIEYIINLFDEKKKGSLYYNLMKKGYISGKMVVGPIDMQEDFLLFGFIMDLTDSGMENYQ